MHEIVVVVVLHFVAVTVFVLGVVVEVDVEVLVETVEVIVPVVHWPKTEEAVQLVFSSKVARRSFRGERLTGRSLLWDRSRRGRGRYHGFGGRDSLQGR